MATDIVKLLLLCNGVFDILFCLCPNVLPFSVLSIFNTAGFFNDFGKTNESMVLLDVIIVVFFNAGIARIMASHYSDTDAGKMMGILSYILESSLFAHLLYKGNANMPAILVVIVTSIFIGIILMNWNTKQSRSNNNKFT